MRRKQGSNERKLTPSSIMKIPRENFASSDKPFPGWPLHPRGLYYDPRFAREVKADPSGAKATLKKGFPDLAKFSLGISIIDDGKEHFIVEKNLQKWTESK